MPTTQLDHTTTEFSLEHAYWLAKAAELAYADEAKIRAETDNWGFDRCEYIHADLGPSFPIEDTQAFVAGSAEMVLVSFRGTEPTNIKDWLTDTATLAGSGPADTGMVHLGFSRALDSVYPRVLDAVTRFLDGGQTLWFVGHSLGGALAMLGTARMYLEEPRLRADGLYTYGQPRTCDAELATAFDKAFVDRTHRFVNNNDVVPRVPPEPVFTHVEQVRYFDADGKMHDSVSTVQSITDGITGLTTDPFAPASDGIRDHFIGNYLKVLEENLR